MEPVAKRAKKDPAGAGAAEEELVVTRLLANSDVWVKNVFPFLGLGHFIFVAGSCKDLKEHYVKFVETLEDPPTVEHLRKSGRSYLKPLSSKDTFLKHAFVNVSCAEIYKSSKKIASLTQGYKQFLIAKHGTVEVMKWLKGNRKTWKIDGIVCQTAAVRGDFEMVKYARQHGGGWGATAANAAEAGSLDILKYARDNGCCWDDTQVVNNAARNGFIDILDYALEGGCQSWDYGMSAACNGGKIQVIQYLVEKWKVPLKKRACMEAAYGGRLECLKWLRQQGCGWDNSTLYWARARGDAELVEWVRSNGCPGEDDDNSSLRFRL